MPDSINKDRIEPAYAQLADILRRRIAEGVYPPDEKIPSESVMSREHGLSLMTVRQAIGMLTKQGLLKRVQGTGTFVQSLKLMESRFTLDNLREIFQDPKRTQVKVLELSLVRADGKTAETLAVAQGSRVILLRRLFLRDGQPIMFHEGTIRYEPTRPVVEAELNLGPISDLFSGYGGGTAKKGELEVIPTVLGEVESALLARPAGTPTFRMEYVIYDFADLPFGCGWFTALPEILKLKTRLGLWENR
jgi:GntR family transcriptional regulator